MVSRSIVRVTQPHQLKELINGTVVVTKCGLRWAKPKVGFGNALAFGDCSQCE